MLVEKNPVQRSYFFRERKKERDFHDDPVKMSDDSLSDEITVRFVWPSIRLTFFRIGGLSFLPVTFLCNENFLSNFVAWQRNTGIIGLSMYFKIPTPQEIENRVRINRQAAKKRSQTRKTELGNKHKLLSSIETDKSWKRVKTE